MMVIVAGVMIGLCLTIMEQGARKAGKHKKGWCMDSQPKVKVGDRVRIIRDAGYGQTGKVGEVMDIRDMSYGFGFRADGTYLRYWMSKICFDEWELLQPAKEQTMTQQTFKPGDRVRIIRQPSHFIDNCVGKTGTIGDMWWEGGKNRCYTVMYDNELTSNSYPADHLELLSKTLNDLVKGDVVVDKDDTDDTMTVEHVLKPGLYVLLDSDEDTLLYNAKELERRGFIPRQDPEDDKTRLTVAEVAKKLGLNPDKLHIVADKQAA